jgi:hypothetical protein
MQRDAIAFGIENNRAETVGTDRMFFLQHFSPVFCCCCNRRIKSPFSREIDKRPGLRRLVVVRFAQASRYIVGVWEQAEFKTGRAFFGYFCIKHRGIERDGPIELKDRNVCPAESMALHGVRRFAGRW